MMEVLSYIGGGTVILLGIGLIFGSIECIIDASKRKKELTVTVYSLKEDIRRLERWEKSTGDCLRELTSRLDKIDGGTGMDSRVTNDKGHYNLSVTAQAKKKRKKK